MDLSGPAHRFGGLAERLGAELLQRLRFLVRAIPDMDGLATIEHVAHETGAEQAGTKIRNHDVALLRGALRTPVTRRYAATAP